MSPREWRHRIEDLLEAIEKIGRYSEGMDFASFQADPKTIDGVLWNFTVIGEAARSVPHRIREKYPEVPWVEMRGMRNFVIHEYAEVSPHIVWDTIRSDLPPLIPLLRAVLIEK